MTSVTVAMTPSTFYVTSSLVSFSRITLWWTIRFNFLKNPPCTHFLRWKFRKRFLCKFFSRPDSAFYYSRTSLYGHSYEWPPYFYGQSNQWLVPVMPFMSIFTIFWVFTYFLWSKSFEKKYVALQRNSHCISEFLSFPCVTVGCTTISVQLLPSCGV